MAIAQTGAIYKTLTFDGKNSRTYGVYITGEAVFNAPERAVEMISIPGRNGAFALDEGRFENITVTYPAGIFADNETDFAEAISDFRNYLCSRSGYCRLTDEYNPNEYRLAVYKSGLEVAPALLRAGEFNITFECKPQRFLTSGETEISVSSGDTVTNPTLFESSPLLSIKGYGNISFNGYEIKLNNEMLGAVIMREGGQNRDVTGGLSLTRSFNTKAQTFLNTGDTITQEAIKFEWSFKAIDGIPITGTTIGSNSGITGSSASCTQGASPNVTINIPALAFVKGTAASYSNTTVINGTRSDNSTFSTSFVVTVSYLTTNRVIISWTINLPSPSYDTIKNILSFGEIIGESTKPQTDANTIVYIDCDLGDAYKIEDDEYISLNQNVDLGSDLPKLAPGSNTVIFDNTVTELKITPGWWKV